MTPPQYVRYRRVIEILEDQINVYLYGDYFCYENHIRKFTHLETAGTTPYFVQLHDRSGNTSFDTSFIPIISVSIFEIG